MLFLSMMVVVDWIICYLVGCCIGVFGVGVVFEKMNVR